MQLALAASSSGQDEAKRLEETRREIKRLTGELSGVRDQQSRLREELKASEKQIGAVSITLKQLAGKQRMKAGELSSLLERRRAAESMLTRQRDALERQIVAAYMMGHEGRMQIIFNQQDPATLGRMLHYYDYFNRARMEQMELIRASLAEIDVLQSGIATEQTELDRLSAERAGQIEVLDASRQTRQETLAKLDTEIKSREQKIASLKQDERSLSDLVSKLREALRDMPVDLPDGVPFAKLKGKLPWPVKGKLAARYGSSRGETEKLTWRGIVIDANEGDDVHAVYNGRVVFADWMRGFGMLVIIDHGGGYMSLYGHNQSLYKAVGDAVRKGETIATVGNSGGSNKPGLYFELRYNGVPDNPSPWLVATSR
ncbi:MAG: peptidoglycan DD-metalloendopeptidase family protein [Chromatiales bacterium]|nr:peptidoglycan DD-metalloendopeptidase family protein [Chromatiales bacterium]